MLCSTTLTVGGERIRVHLVFVLDVSYPDEEGLSFDISGYTLGLVLSL